MKNLFNRLYKKIFGHDLSNYGKKFFQNIYFSIGGGVIAGAIMFGVNILAGRWLGPSKYGNLSMVISIAQILIIFYVFSLDLSSVRAISKAKTNTDKIEFITGSLIVSSIATISTILIVLLLKKPLAHLIGLSENFLIYSILFAIILAIKTLLDSFIRGVERFKFQSKIKILESVLALAIFFILFKFLHHPNIANYIISLTISSLITILIYYNNLKSFFNFRYDSYKTNLLVNYAKIGFSNALLATILNQTDKLIINKYLGSYNLGIYTAYYTVSIVLIGQLLLAGTNVFFPTIAKIDDKKSLLKKIDRFTLISYLPFLLVLSLIISFSIILFGRSYPLVIRLILLFANLGALQFYASIYSSIVNVHSNDTFKKGVTFYIFRSLLYVFMIALLIKSHSLTTTSIILTLIFIYLLDICNSRHIIAKYS